MASELRKFMVPECVVGEGAAALVGRCARNLGARHCLVVSDPGVAATGLVERTVALLAEDGLASTVFAAVSPNPRDHQVMAGTEVFRRCGADLVVAVGGGSPMDCAKGIAVVAANGGHILDYEGVDRIARPGPPMVFIPTTAGTAADVSQFAIITDSARRVKIALVSKLLVPDVALVDPATTRTLDRHLTACTGLDVLTHAMEALASTAHWRLTDLCALDAVRLVAGNLARAVADADDAGAHAAMAQASMQAGYAFSNVSLGAVHAMAHSLGGLLDLPHGECNALLLEHVVRFNWERAATAYEQAAEALGLAGGCEGLVAGLHALRLRLGVDGGLAARGVRHEHLAALAAAAHRDPCLVTNPRPATPAELEGIYAAAL
ncbi:MAG: iron-containing alcohol dehydrogenase [Planctomycetes bacterium]|nr:iron-containing alcohol dehydrogenase [Planctomycetota bacterium]